MTIDPTLIDAFAFAFLFLFGVTAYMGTLVFCPKVGLPITVAMAIAAIAWVFWRAYS